MPVDFMFLVDSLTYEALIPVDFMFLVDSLTYEALIPVDFMFLVDSLTNWNVSKFRSLSNYLCTV